MNTRLSEDGSRRIACLNLLASIGGFGLSVWLYWGYVQGGFWARWQGEWYWEVAISAAIAWVSLALSQSALAPSVRQWIDQFFTTLGLNLMLQYGVAYLWGIRPVPWPVAVAGTIFTLALRDIWRRVSRAAPAGKDPILLVGYNSMAAALAGRLGSRVAGIVDRAPALIPQALPGLGGLDQLEQVVFSRGIRHVVMTDPRWRDRISARDLLALRYAGITVEDGRVVFEDLLQRVCAERLSAVELLTMASIDGNRSAIVLQAVYTNLVGLGLLLVSAPVLILAGIALVFSTQAAPFESHICLGFQRIPFRLMRFRTRRRSGEATFVGKLIEALHLVDWPRVINVVRGEMALFGPPPARQEFAARLVEMLPAYIYRFAVKPGLLGWSQCNLPDASPAPDEILRLEYDLYYAREESPSLDLDILLRSVFRRRLFTAGGADFRADAAGTL